MSASFFKDGRPDSEPLTVGDCREIDRTADELTRAIS